MIFSIAREKPELCFIACVFNPDPSVLTRSDEEIVAAGVAADANERGEGQAALEAGCARHSGFSANARLESAPPGSDGSPGPTVDGRHRC